MLLARCALAAHVVEVPWQAGKVGLGKVRSCVLHFEGALVLHVADFPVVISFVGSPVANVGLMEAAVPMVLRALEPVKRLAAPISL